MAQDENQRRMAELLAAKRKAQKEKSATDGPGADAKSARSAPAKRDYVRRKV